MSCPRDLLFLICPQCQCIQTNIGTFSYPTWNIHSGVSYRGKLSMPLKAFLTVVILKWNFRSTCFSHLSIIWLCACEVMTVLDLEVHRPMTGFQTLIGRLNNIWINTVMILLFLPEVRVLCGNLNLNVSNQSTGSLLKYSAFCHDKLAN